MTPGDEVLERLFDRYRAALNANRRRGAGRDLETAEAVIEARVVLYEYLVGTGWEPPPGVSKQLALDALLLEQPPSELTG